MDGFLVEPQNKGRARTTWEPSHEWRLAEATPSSRGFQWFTRKPLGSLVDPQSQDRRIEDRVAAAPDWSDRWVWTVWPVRSTDLTCVRWRSLEASKRRTRVGIARLTSSLSNFAVAGHLSDGVTKTISQRALVGMYPRLGLRGNLVYWVASIQPKRWEDGSHLLEL
jgi:hypothetical protein